MANRYLTGGIAALLLLAVAAPAAAQNGAAQNIGVAAAVKNDVTGVVKGKQAALAAGQSVVRDQTIRTGADSTAQLLFLDETSLSVGPRSEVTLDRFVYNPATRTTQIAVNATKGMMRFISGSSDPRGYTLKTPAATIGFRGSVADVIAGDPTIIILVEGILEITLPNGQKVILDVPGQAVAISRNTYNGPFKWDGQYAGVVLAASYPLFATGFLGDPERKEFPDDKFNMMDELNSQIVEDECEGYWCYCESF